MKWRLWPPPDRGLIRSLHMRLSKGLHWFAFGNGLPIRLMR